MNKMANPYIAGSPVTGPEMFFGRKDVFNFVRQALTGKHRDHVLVLYGQRRTGKTSVLYQMHRHLGPGYLCVFIDLHGLALEGLSGFMWELANHISRSLQRNHQIQLPRLERADFMMDPRDTFESAFLEAVWTGIGDRHLLLMLDEAVRLEEQVEAGRLEPEVFDYLRHLMQHYPQLNFLFSLGSGLEEMEKEYAFLFNVALYKKISFLDRQAAMDLITQPVAGLYEVQSNAAQHILDLTSAHPYFIQLICHSLFNYARSGSLDSITVQEVDAVLEEAVERGLAVLKHVWEESTPAEKAVLAGMAAAMGESNQPVSSAQISKMWARLGVDIPSSEMVLAIKSLIARDVIAGENNYAFTVDLQRKWIRKYRRLEWVKEEIGPADRDWKVQKRGIWTRLDFMGNRIFFFAFSVLVLLGIGFVFYSLFYSAPVARPTTTGPEGAAVIPGGEAALVNDLASQGETIWAATDGGLARWSPDGSVSLFRGEDLGFGDNWMQSIIASSDGTLWISGGGVAHVRPDGNRLITLDFYTKDDGLSTGAIRVLASGQDSRIWAGGFHAEGDPPPLDYYDGTERDGESWQTDAPLSNALARLDIQTNIGSILQSEDGSLWLGVQDFGIVRWDKNRLIEYPLEKTGNSGPDADMRVREILQDRSGIIWAAGSDLGLLRFDNDQDQWIEVSITGEDIRIRSIAEFSDGSLWVGGDRFVARSTDGGRSWALVGTAAGLCDDIGALAEDSTGQVWVGAYSAGVSVLRNENWEPIQCTIME